MSALTKLFVVLLVVCSLLVSASVVVFVNRVEDYRAWALQTQDKEALTKATADDALHQVESLKIALKDQRDVDEGRVNDMRARFETANKAVGDVQTQLADAKKTLTVEQAETTKMTEALKASQTENENAQKVVNAARERADDLEKKNHDLTQAYTVAISDTDALKKQRDYMAEQITELRTENQNLQRQVVAIQKQLGPGGGNGSETPVPNVAVNGRVIERTKIGGVDYARINVGSADNVVRGMKFNAINRATGDFLGVVTIDQVQPNEAAGRLDGPKTGDVQRGTEVRTQL